MYINSQIMDMNFSVAMTTGETDWLIVFASPGSPTQAPPTSTLFLLCSVLVFE